MMRARLTAVFFLMMLCDSRPAPAQDVRAYVGGTVEISTWGVHSWSGAPDVTYNNTSTDTTVVGVTGEAGWLLGRHAAVGVELDIPFGRNDVTTIHGYFEPFTRQSQYRETSIFGVIHGYVPVGSKVQAGIFGGGGAVFGNSLYQESECNFDPHVPCTPFGPVQEITRSSFGLTVGGDLVVKATRHLSVVSRFRLVWAARGGDPASSSDSATAQFVILGLDQVSYRASLGLRATF
jgi:Outer membrane protein beta-barrel domain